MQHIRILAVLASAGAALMFAGTAQAAPAHLAHAARPAVGSTWQDNKDSLYADTYLGQDWTADPSGSAIGSATNCMSGTGFCEHTTPNGDCLTYESEFNIVANVACQGLERQYWELTHYTYGAGSGYVWQNYYASAIEGCSTALTSNGGGGVYLTVVCADGGGGGYGQAQLWN
jgi:hypothetical protein